MSGSIMKANDEHRRHWWEKQIPSYDIWQPPATFGQYLWMRPAANHNSNRNSTSFQMVPHPKQAQNTKSISVKDNVKSRQSLLSWIRMLFSFFHFMNWFAMVTLKLFPRYLDRMIYGKSQNLFNLQCTASLWATGNGLGGRGSASVVLM